MYSTPAVVTTSSSCVMYAAVIPLAFVHPLLACLLYIVVAIMWLVPDRRIEKVLTEA